MVASETFAEFLRDQLTPLGRVTMRCMFGKTGLFCDGIMFGMVRDDTLYFRVDDHNQMALKEAASFPPLNYEKKGRTIDLAFWRAPERLFDDPDGACGLGVNSAGGGAPGCGKANSRKLVKEEIDGGNPAVPDDNEIGSGVSGRLAGTARHPQDPTAIANLLRRGERLIAEVGMGGLDQSCDAVDLVAAAIGAFGFVEHGVFVEDLTDRDASTHRVDLAEHVAEIAKR
jgi:DNA transformation protein and related proteins